MNRTIAIIRNAAKSDFGGGEKVPVFLARELMGFGLRPIIFSRSKKLLSFANSESVESRITWWWPKQNWSGGHVVLFPLYIGWQFLLYFYYIYMFSTYSTKTVHIQSKDDFIAGTFAARTLGLKVLWSDYADLKHIWKNHSIWYKNPVGKLVYLAAHLAEIIIVVSQEDSRLVSEHIPDGIVKSKLTVIYNGAFDSYKEIIKNNTFTFISMSRLVTDKGVAELISAFSLLNQEYPDTQLQILGDGPDKDKFIKLAKGHKMISFLGHKSNPLAYCAKAHTFILPTYHEGFSLALVEACMEKLAVIATDVGGNPEIIIDKKTGLLVEAKNVHSLYQAMKTLYLDTSLREQLATNARKQYEDKFNFKTIIEDEFLPLYER